ncbi:MAG: hypothetical protein LBI69_03180 [Puniceicoccales bacterium]|nr:hypothetical protein [Puniceicoccales bacterium]
MALKILSDNTMKPQVTSKFSESKHMSVKKMVNVLNMVCTPNAMNKIANILRLMYFTSDCATEL